MQSFFKFFLTFAMQILDYLRRLFKTFSKISANPISLVWAWVVLEIHRRGQPKMVVWAGFLFAGLGAKQKSKLNKREGVPSPVRNVISESMIATNASCAEYNSR
jgi:hypothetical protein